MFQNATNSTMTNCNFTIVNGDNHNYSNKPVLEVLYEKAAPGGFHISDERYDPPKCHEDTRLAIRQDLLDQVKIAVVSCIIWLYGAAGAGKSAIAQSFAETCQKQGLLIGTFFFFRAAPMRNNALRLAASLAYQLGRSIPSTLPHIARCISSDPAIFSSSFEEQINELIVEPLRRACEEDPELKPKPRLVILDGLDECDTPDIQRNAITVLEKALKAIPIPIIALIVSRPEIHISSTFESLERRASIPTFRFGLNDKYDVDDDIRIYLNDKFDEIKRDHPFKKHLPDNWPSPNDIESIVTKSSGQYIYAATIVRYVRHHNKPHIRLQTALDAAQRFVPTDRNSPFYELDALYHQIFSGIEDRLPLLAILFLALNIDKPRNPARCPRTIAFRLGLGPGDVEIEISKLASLMKYEGENTPIRFFHASLQDFLVDEQRSHVLYINQPAVHTILSKAYCTFLASVPLDALLLSSLCHLRLAELDQELTGLVVKVERNILKSIKAFHFKGMERKWFEESSYEDLPPNPPFCNPSYFSDYVGGIFSVKSDLARITKNHTFWDECIGAIHEVFRIHFSVYLTDENTHDLLAIVALTKEMFTIPMFAWDMGVSEATLEKCCDPEIFKSRYRSSFFDGVAQEILENFLLDPDLAGKLLVTPEQCARVGEKCLSIILNIGSLDKLGRDEVSLNRERACFCKCFALCAMLQVASESQKFIDGLKTFDRCYQRPSDDRFNAVINAQRATKTYLSLRADPSKSPAGRTTQNQESCEELVEVVEVPSIGLRVRKWLKRVTSSDNTHTTAESNTGRKRTMGKKT